MFVPALEISRQDIRVRDLPADLDGYCIAHISDLHVGRGVWQPAHIALAAEAIVAARPDVVVNTGDYLQGKPSMSSVGAVVAAFAVPEIPSLAILGNHDYYAGDELVTGLMGELEALGVTVLVNASTRLFRGDSAVSFAGIMQDDPDFEVPRAIEVIQAMPWPRVVLVHKPELAELFPPRSADLILAGHTHGAQVAIPFLEQMITRHMSRSRYVSGMYDVNGMPLYVNRGLGATGLPVRFRANPEVALVRLVR